MSDQIYSTIDEKFKFKALSFDVALTFPDPEKTNQHQLPIYCVPFNATVIDNQKEFIISGTYTPIDRQITSIGKADDSVIQSLQNPETFKDFEKRIGELAIENNIKAIYLFPSRDLIKEEPNGNAITIEKESVVKELILEENTIKALKENQSISDKSLYTPAPQYMGYPHEMEIKDFEVQSKNILDLGEKEHQPIEFRFTGVDAYGREYQCHGSYVSGTDNLSFSHEKLNREAVGLHSNESSHLHKPYLDKRLSKKLLSQLKTKKREAIKMSYVSLTPNELKILNFVKGTLASRGVNEDNLEKFERSFIKKMKNLHEQGKEATLEIYDKNAPSRNTQSIEFTSPNKDKERMR